MYTFSTCLLKASLFLYIVLVLSTVSVVCVHADSVSGLWLLSQHVNKSRIELNYYILCLSLMELPISTLCCVCN
jgi:hypothetical protein